MPDEIEQQQQEPVEAEPEAPESEAASDPFAALEAAMRENDGVLALEEVETEEQPESQRPEGVSDVETTPVSETSAGPPSLPAEAPQEGAAAVTPPPAPGTATATPQTGVLAEDFYPAEWEGHPVIEGGVGLYDARYEDEDNPEAIDRVAELAEKFGGDEARAEREYAREVSAYEREKSRFEAAQLQREETEAQKAITSSLRANRLVSETRVKSSYDTILPGLGDAVLAEFHADAVDQVRKGIATFAEGFERQGLSPRRAIAKANALLGSDPSLYDDALNLAIAADPVRFARFLQTRLATTSPAATTAEGVASPAAVAPPSPPVTPTPASQPPRLTPPPISGSGRGAGGGNNPQTSPSRITPTDSEKQIAAELGFEPGSDSYKRFLQTHRELTSGNGVR